VLLLLGRNLRACSLFRSISFSVKTITNTPSCETCARELLEWGTAQSVHRASKSSNTLTPSIAGTASRIFVSNAW
jgi:hypothetical protein